MSKVLAALLIFLALLSSSSPRRTNHEAGSWFSLEITVLTEGDPGHDWVQGVRRFGSAGIQITFNRPMDSDSLSPTTVRIISEKQSRDMTQSFRFAYDHADQTLTLYPVNPKFGFGTGNIVTVRVSSRVQDNTGKPMGKDVEWSFST